MEWHARHISQFIFLFIFLFLFIFFIWQECRCDVAEMEWHAGPISQRLSVLESGRRSYVVHAPSLGTQFTCFTSTQFTCFTSCLC
jgi:hypothetical protein